MESAVKPACACVMCKGEALPASGPIRDRAEGWADGYTDGVKYGLERADMLASALKGLMDNVAVPAKPEDSDAYKAWLWAESAYEIYKGMRRG